MKKEDFIKGDWYIFADKKDNTPKYILRFREFSGYEFKTDAYIRLNTNKLEHSGGSLSINSFKVYLATYNDLKNYITTYPKLFPQHFSKTSNKDVVLDNAEMCLKMSNHSNKSTKRNQLTW